jgi:hypothetical protein
MNTEIYKAMTHTLKIKLPPDVSLTEVTDWLKLNNVEAEEIMSIEFPADITKGEKRQLIHLLNLLKQKNTIERKLKQMQNYRPTNK